MNNINTALLHDFIDESKEHLDEMESLLLQISSDLDNTDLLNDIFRTMHNVKGASQITGLDKISRLSHRLEDLLDLLRQDQMPLSAKTIDLLITGRDRIVQLVSELEESQQELSSVDELIDRLSILMAGDEPVKHESDQTPATLETDVPGSTEFNAEDYQERNDEELFGIFAEQLKEYFDLLSSVSSQFREANADAGQLNKCLDLLNRLRSSANYMGYGEMVGLFDQWIVSLESAVETFQNGEVVSLGFMDINLDHLVTQFPQLRDTLLSVSVDEPAISAKQSASIDDDITSSVLNIFNEEADEPAQESLSSEAFTDVVDNHINTSLLNDFIDESRENLQEMELLLIHLVTDTDRVGNLNEIFRTMHNIKGASQLTGLDKVSRLAHRLEDLLDLLRQQELNTDETIVEILISGRDRIVTLIDELEQSQQEITSVDDLVEQLTGLIEGTGSTSPEAFQRDQNHADFSATENKPGNVPESSAPRVEVSQFKEEHDFELFNIFTAHLHEQLASIASCVMRLNDSPDRQDLLKDCIDSISSLHSSANYMGYEELTGFYQLWMGEVDRIILAMTGGEQVSLDIMQTYPAELARVFPQLIQDSNVERSPARPQQQAVDTKPVVLPIADTTDEDAHSTSDEKELFDRMNGALESSLQIVSRSERETLNEVFDELVSGQATEESSMTGKPAEARGNSPRPKPGKGAGQLARSDYDRRGDDRRKGGEALEKKARKSVRVDAEKIDVLMNQVGELVVDRSYFFQLFNEMRELQQYLKETTGIDQKDVKLIRAFTYRLGEAISGLGRTSNELQEGVMKMRMLPVSHLFNRYPRLVHDLTGKLNKKVKLMLSGEETELDRMIVEELSDPLIHIIRNAIDHGIESAEERDECGKPEEGKLILEAYQESNHIVIQVTDDGRGLDPEKIKKKAVDNELYTGDEVERLNEREVFNLILMPGFSTAEKITGTSGRGVGMDVVKKNIEKLNGTLDIDSKQGKGTQMRLKIPLTLAIIHALMVRIGSDMFTIPLANVDETVRISQDDTSLVEGVEVIYLRGVALPIFRLSNLFKVSSDKNVDKSFVVIVNTDGQRIGFVVDELLGQEEVVIKPLEDYVQENSGFSGATVIGDGRISLILDVYELVKMTTRRQNIRQKKQAEMLKMTRPKLTGNTEANSARLH